MASRFYTLNRFIAPDFSLLVPNWTFGIGTEHYRAASHAYEGPLYILLTPVDAAVLINVSPERERDAVALVCRLPHEQRIDHAPAGALREATPGESMSALSRLAAADDWPGGGIDPDGPVWVAGTTGLLIRGEPHRIALFRFAEGRARDLVHSTEGDRIALIGEE